jgi:nicotinamide-nucleotide amidase
MEPVPLPKSVFIIIVGDEILTGSTRDRNGAALAVAATGRGGRVIGIQVVPDATEAIRAAVESAAREASVILVAGGLGPTTDDLTREGIATALGRELVEATEWTAQLDAWVTAGYLRPGTSDKQAMLPAGARLVRNPFGTAASFAVTWDDSALLALPGVPTEIEALLAGDAGAVLDEWLEGSGRPERRVRLFGVPESHASSRSGRLPELEALEVAFYPHNAAVDVVVRAPPGADASDGRLDAAQAALVREFGADVYEVGVRPLSEVVLERLRTAGHTLSVAESCTGGYLGKELTAVAGASDVFWGGVISYSNEAKTRLLDVPVQLLESRGAVSEDVARALATGVRKISGTDWGLAVTGIAGPGGGTEDKPVGTVWISVAGPNSGASRFTFGGGRERIRARSVQFALDMLRRALNGATDG